MATTNVNVEPRGTIPLTGGAHGPFPCWISIQQSTLSPRIKNKKNKSMNHFWKLVLSGVNFSYYFPLK